MKPVGKTYLIKIEKPKEEVCDGIIIPQTASDSQVIHYIGHIVDYGTGFTKKEISELVPIGSKVILDWKTKDPIGKVQIKFGPDIFYIYDPKYVIAVIEEEEEN